jgi:acyl CoA:acetate/3-ketoacid CoA transferase alpha subunit
MNKLFPDAASALEGLLKNDILIASGGFGLCGLPERLLDAVRDSGVTGHAAVVARGNPIHAASQPRLHRQHFFDSRTCCQLRVS